MTTAFKNGIAEPPERFDAAGNPVAPGEVIHTLGKPPLKDPKEIDAFVSERLAAYERDQRTVWNKIVRAITALRPEG
jgi:hypothetical protein